MTDTMPHQEIIDLFSDYYDEELEAPQVEELEAHFEDCEACRDEYDSFKGSLSLFGGLREAHVPDDFLKEVTTTINRQSRGTFFKESWIFGLRVPYEAFIALLLVVFGAIYFFGVSNRSTFVVADEEEATDSSPDEAMMGRALGAQSHKSEVRVSRSVDLQQVAASLRKAGFATAFDVVESEVAVVVSVQSKDLPAFQTALDAAAGESEPLDQTALSRHPNLSVRILNND